MKKLSESSNKESLDQALGLAKQEAIVQILRECVDPGSIVMFGSFAKGMNREDSDLDLAYIARQTRPNAYERFRIASTLADAVGREVDLIDFEQASPVLQAQIISDGVLLHDGEPDKRQQLFMRSLKEYAMLNEERSEIIEKRMREDRT